MSMIQDPRVEPKPGSPADPFRYGWRYVVRRQPSGRLGREQIPLTLEDLLFPEEGDFAVQLPSHINDCLHLKMIFDNRLASDPEALVLTDCRVDYNIRGVKPLGPDVAVFLGVPSDWDRGTLKIAEDSAAPVLVVEVTSPDTRKNDFGIKKDFYHRAGVPLYVIVDARPGRKGRRVKLHGFRHTPEGYESIPLDDQGRLWIEPMELWMAIENERVVCYDGRTGERIGDYGEQVQAKEEWRARAETEARAKDEWRAIAETEARAKDEWRAIAETEARNTAEWRAIAETEARAKDEWRAIAETEARNTAEWRAIAEAESRNRAKAEALIEDQTRLLTDQARIIDLSDQIRDAQKAKIDDMEVELRASGVKVETSLQAPSVTPVLSLAWADPEPIPQTIPEVLPHGHQDHGLPGPGPGGRERSRLARPV